VKRPRDGGRDLSAYVVGNPSFPHWNGKKKSRMWAYIENASKRIANKRGWRKGSEGKGRRKRGLKNPEDCLGAVK